MTHKRSSTGRRTAAAALVALLASAAVADAGVILKDVGPDWLELDLFHRTRYETLDNQFRAGRTGGDQALMLQTRLKATATAGRYAFTGEFIDARAELGDAGGALDTNAVDAAELVQAFLAVDLGALGPAEGAKVKLGRQLVNVGAGRLVGANIFRNTPNAFAGMDLDLTLGQGRSLRLLYLLPQIRLPADQASVLDNQVVLNRNNFDTQLYGGVYSQPLALFPRRTGLLELVGLHLAERDDNPSVRTRNRRLTTLSGRVYQAPAAGQFDAELEGGIQFGKSRATAAVTDTRDLDVFAHYAHGTVGYRFDRPWQPRIAAYLDYASGDSDPTDGRQGGFDFLYGPVRGDLGPTSLFTHVLRSNLISPGARLTLAPNDRTKLMVGVREVFLASATDSNAGTGVRDVTGASGQHVGTQLQWLGRYELLKDIATLEAGGAFFREGRFLEDAPNATPAGDSTYLYTSLEFRL